jgi:hypothetical protein
LAEPRADHWVCCWAERTDWRWAAMRAGRLVAMRVVLKADSKDPPWADLTVARKVAP